MKKESPFYGLFLLIGKIGVKTFPFILKIIKSAKFIKVTLAAASFAAYSYIFTWKFSLLILIALFFHESGHVYAMKRRGIKTKGFYFIPFVGGVAVPDQKYESRADIVYVSIMGPIWGLGLAFISLVIFYITQNPLWAGAASWMAWLNLLNLLPINPLDGGRILRSIVMSKNLVPKDMQVKKSTKIIFFLIGLGIAAIIAYGFKMEIVALLVLLGFLEIHGIIGTKPDDVTPMDKKTWLRYLIIYIITAQLLFIIMQLSSHIPGADAAIKSLK